MTSELLPAIQIEIGPNPDATVIWLHGLGDDGNGWSQVVGSLGLPRGKAVRFIFPHAPVIPITINNGMAMRAWYDFKQADASARADLAGVRRSQAQIEALIANEVERGVPSRRIVLAGFSQGGAIALYAGLRHAERLAGIVALSTYLIDSAGLATEAAPANRDIPIFMAHGTQDQVIQFAWADMSRRSLIDGGWNVEWHTYTMAHAAVLEEIVACGKFLNAVLGAD